MSGRNSICAIIPTYNRAAMLKESIDSVLAQTQPVDQIVVVNDGSTDDTESVVKSYGDRVSLLNKQNGGKSSSVNMALGQVTADVVWICDDDDIAAPDAVEHLAPAMEADPELNLCMGAYCSFRDKAEGRVFAPPVLCPIAEEPNIHLHYLEGMFTYQFASLIRRQLFDHVGLLRTDIDRAADYDMFMRMTRNMKAAYTPHICFYQRQHDGMRGGSNNQIGPEQIIEKQLGYDKLLFVDVRKNYTLNDYTPTFARNWDTARAQRSALLQKACIFARHEMWDDAREDIAAAYKMSSSSLLPEEARLLRRVAKRAAPWEWRAIYKQLHDWLPNIRACRVENEFGQLLVYEACRPLVGHARWALENRDMHDFTLMTRLLISILGVHGASTRVLSSLVS